MTPFTENALKVIKSIPKGKVMTYKGIATACGNPKAARQITRVLHSMSEKYSLPWHRVINSKGEISLPLGSGGDIQASLLEGEGVEVINGKIDLSIYEYRPEMEAMMDFEGEDIF